MSMTRNRSCSSSPSMDSPFFFRVTSCRPWSESSRRKLAVSCFFVVRDRPQLSYREEAFTYPWKKMVTITTRIRSAQELA